MKQPRLGLIKKAMGSLIERLRERGPYHPWWIRPSKIAFRSFHIVAFSMVLGASWAGADADILSLPWMLSGISGVGLMAVFMVSNLAWPIQVRGLGMLAKILLIVLLATELRNSALFLIVVAAYSSIVAHMPGKLRDWPVYPKVREK